MRLSSTLQRELVELPPPPGPVGMYVCGPTVYARAHIGNARPYVVGSWYARWLRRRGYEVTLVHNITDVNDKIYEAARRGVRGGRRRLLPRLEQLGLRPPLRPAPRPGRGAGAEPAQGGRA